MAGTVTFTIIRGALIGTGFTAIQFAVHEDALTFRDLTSAWSASTFSHDSFLLVFITGLVISGRV